MTERHKGKEYDFINQLEAGQEREDKLKAALKDGKFEVKSERNLWHETGNIVIEFESYSKPSGIAATDSDYWAHELRTLDGETLVYLMFPNKQLNKICNQLMSESDKNWRVGGENKAQKMILLKLSKLFERLPNMEGPGDENFTGYKKQK